MFHFLLFSEFGEFVRPKKMPPAMFSRSFSPLDFFSVLLVVVLGVILGRRADAAPPGAEVKHFPGFDGQIPSKHYAGNIMVGTQLDKRHLYYYFATSERNPSKDPITLWIQGGHGCSGLDGLIHLIGPFKLEDNDDYISNGTKVKINPFSWTQVSSIIFVDSPVGAGYSYADSSEDYTADDTMTISDLYDFVLKWFSMYPEFLSNPFYLAGCSYGGVIVPPLAEKIVNGIEARIEPIVNFKGYSLGNGAFDYNIDMNGKIPFAYRMGLISDELYMVLASSCNGNYWNNSHPDCLKDMVTFQKDTDGINEEHVLCLPCHHEIGITVTSKEHASVRMYRSLKDETAESPYCYDYNEHPKRLFNLQSARRSLHAFPEEVTGQWMRCTNRLDYNRNIMSLIPYHLNLTMKGYRAFIYNGDHDMVVPYIATLKAIRMLNYSEIEKWRPWFVEDQIAGYTIQYDHNLLFATFKGAGHTVSEYMPREALHAYKKWIDGAESL